MSDLISRKALLEMFQQKADENSGLLRNNMLFAKKLVESQPTAYDVDKVVEELELHKLNPYFAAYERKRINEAIEIVKGGGVDGN